MKKLIIFLIMFMPIFVGAACDYELQNQYTKYAYDISSDSEYLGDKVKKFNVILYNVNNDFKVKYNGVNYNVVDNKVSINNVKEGTQMRIEIFAPSGCDEPARIIYINQPYFNEFYGSTMCYGYDGKVSYCTYKFLQYAPTLELVESAIYNYNNGLVSEDDKEEEKPFEELTFGEKVVDLVDTKLLKLFMFIFTAYLTYVIYNDLYIKVKHKL